MAYKILIIDDDQVTIKIMKARLEKEGYESLVALDGDVGLEKVKSDTPQLILLDVEMPRLNGYTFMIELKKIEDKISKKIPVIILTSHEEMQPVFELKGVKGYLMKPVDFEKLFKLIKESL